MLIFYSFIRVFQIDDSLSLALFVKGALYFKMNFKINMKFYTK